MLMAIILGYSVFGVKLLHRRECGALFCGESVFLVSLPQGIQNAEREDGNAGLLAWE
jgi:hypothetical protein